MRILVIDCDQQSRQWFSACAPGALGLLPDAVSTAKNTTEALALLEGERPFDLALVAIDDGPEESLAVFKQVSDSSRRLPRIALTDGEDVGLIKRALAAGASDFLVRPLMLPDLVETVTRVMASVEVRRRNWQEQGAFVAIKRDIDIAADMQRRILPQRFPDDHGLDVAAIMQPARGVGGDFYDVFVIDNTHVGVLIADVSGKGIPAAFYMAVASTTLRAVGQRGLSPGECLAEVNTYLYQRDIPGMFVSVFYAVIDTEQWQVRCANAGHSAPLIGATGQRAVSPFNSEGGPVLGIIDGIEYAESSFCMDAGDSLFLYTDGVSEAMDANRQQFGEERIAGILAEHLRSRTEGLIGAVRTALDNFTTSAEQHDDITAIAIRRAA